VAFAIGAIEDGLPPSMVAGLLVNGFYGISAHPLDQGDPVRAAVRAVGEAISRLDVESDDDGERMDCPRVQIPGDTRKDSDFAEELGRALAELDFYNNGGQLACIRNRRLFVPDDVQCVTVFQRHADFWAWEKVPKERKQKPDGPAEVSVR